MSTDDPGSMTDWDLIHRWEWFRREKWRQGFRAHISGAGGGPARAFGDLANSIDAKVVLDASCGLGRRAILLAEKGLNVLGSDVSGTAITHARELARDENSPVTFFRSAWNDLPKNMPHHFDGILVTGLNLEPSWDHLGIALVGLYHALQPGGFLMFVGATENEPPTSGPAERVEREWKIKPAESVEWFNREGRVTCALVNLRYKAADYIDERFLYVSEENGESRLESTTLRRPAYWTWTHWKDVTRMAGFQSLETRQYKDFGIDGGDLLINVAWKGTNPRSDTSIRASEHEERYED